MKSSSAEELRAIIDRQNRLIAKQHQALKQVERDREERAWSDEWDRVAETEQAQKARVEALGTVSPMAFCSVSCRCDKPSDETFQRHGQVRCWHCPRVFTSAREYDAHKGIHH